MAEFDPQDLAPYWLPPASVGDVPPGLEAYDRRALSEAHFGDTGYLDVADRWVRRERGHQHWSDERGPAPYYLLPAGLIGPPDDEPENGP